MAQSFCSRLSCLLHFRPLLCCLAGPSIYLLSPVFSLAFQTAALLSWPKHFVVVSPVLSLALQTAALLLSPEHPAVLLPVLSPF